MDRDHIGTAANGLEGYIAAVIDQLGEVVVAADCEADHELATAIIILTCRIPAIPECELLLSWDEINGWALRVKVDEDGDTTAFAYAAREVLPPPRDVQRFLSDAVRGEHPGSVAAPNFRSPQDDDDLERRLLEFA